ncbi:MAG: NADH-quinone oxidoreductase subunit C [Candidatus Omnitrophica bacterium]|nr:NADH-quinone oxidoreductase subunit C [Candidatus Omnitrophota bacterium]
MTQEEKIKQGLEEKFNLGGAVVIQRPSRIFADISLENFEQVFAFATTELGFTALSAITGLDRVEDFAVIYHLNLQGRIMLNLRVAVNKNDPRVKTVTAVFPGAEMYEREMTDLLGIKVFGLAPGDRYPLPDNWPAGQYPLRKDWKPDHSKTAGVQNA